MRATIKSIRLENFKGVKKPTDYMLDGKNISVIGQNGAGKTTLFIAYMWLMADKDSDLKSNPNIRPLDAEECTPRVEIVFNNGDFDIAVAKIQKCTIKKSKTGGADTVSLSNSYEVNSVEYGERDFKKKMQEYGFDLDLFLPMSHPEVFTSQKSADMRKVLFGMASEKSDKEIAELTEGAADIAEMLENYTADEVKAMQNATLRKIREDYGKDGEILRAKIEGMEQSKTDIDVAELELQKNTLNEQIAENKTKQEDISKEFEEQQKASDGVIELKMELNAIQQKANESLENKRREIRNELSDLNSQLKEVRHQIRLNKQDIEAAKKVIDKNTVLINATRENWKAANERVFDENSLICRYCGQEFQEERKVQIKADFGKNREEELAFLTKRGNELKAAIDKDKAEIEQLKTKLKENEDEEINLAESIKGLEKCLEEVPQSVDISDRSEVQEIQRQIAEKEQAMNKGNSAEGIRQQLKDEAEDLQSQLTEVEKQLALAQKNLDIEEQIADLRKKQGEFEQNRANAEKILYQLDLVSKRKNELLTDQVNSHFKMVKFRLFDYLKNGNVVDDCEPLIDGKSLKDHSNGALRVLAKLDIVDGLQRFYGQYYPVFADDFSLVTDNTECRIDMECQLIKLVAEKGVKELKIETEDLK